jgi:HD-GYP domain-containing protein (c-di-GMP phosphodiesterase class II)
MPVNGAKSKTGGAGEKAVVTVVYRVTRLSLVHDPSNEIFILPVSELVSRIRSFVEDEGVFSLVSNEGEIFINGRRVRQDVTNINACEYLVRRIDRLGVGGFETKTVPDEEEIKLFTAFFAKVEVDGSTEGELAVRELDSRLSKVGVSSFRFLVRYERVNSDDDQLTKQRPANPRERTIKLYENMMDFIKQALTDQKLSTAPINIKQAKRLVHQFVDVSANKGGDFSISWLSTIKNHDDYTFNHSVNVCILAIAFGQKLGFRRNKLAELGLGALFHDFGKINIPRSILNKPGALSKDEWDVMKRHPLAALRLMFDMHSFTEGGIKKVLVAIEHHMNYDLTGYPRLVLERHLHLYSRVVAIVDSFDAMTTNRVYQKALRPDEAIREMLKYSGIRYDPLLLKAFIMCMGIYPVGTAVLLNNGDLCVVSRASPQSEMLDRPKVVVVADRDGSEVRRGEEVDLSLAENQELCIVKSVDPEVYNLNVPHFLLYL